MSNRSIWLHTNAECSCLLPWDRIALIARTAVDGRRRHSFHFDLISFEECSSANEPSTKPTTTIHSFNVITEHLHCILKCAIEIPFISLIIVIIQYVVIIQYHSRDPISTLTLMMTWLYKACPKLPSSDLTSGSVHVGCV